jgi:hypothetical protein
MRVAFSAMEGGPKTGAVTRWQWGIPEIRASSSPRKAQRSVSKARVSARYL